MLSPTTPALISCSSASDNELNLAISVGTTPASTPSQGTGYTLSNIGFQIVHYDMPQSYYQAVDGVLESGFWSSI